MDNMRKQAEKFGAEFITDDVTRVELGDKPTETGAADASAAWRIRLANWQRLRHVASVNLPSWRAPSWMI